ncbi:hypothetical protein [Nocardiopsis akebiae]|uniref:hypothetical protein n=1 Tax=Nocardiopsis akebiae TaxID=2831968 RepID=UPI0030844E2D
MTGEATAFAAPGDETRWSILVRLGRAPASAPAPAEERPISRQATVKHAAPCAGSAWSSPSGAAARWRTARSGRA